MATEFLASLNTLIHVLDGFLESGVRSGQGEDDEVPDEKLVSPGGEVHDAVKAVELFYPNQKLPAPDARNPWVNLCRARDLETDALEWQNKAFKYAKELKTWAEVTAEDALLDELVTLDQVASLARMSKRTLERKLRTGKLPEPDCRGGGGKANKWLWNNLRPYLEELCGLPLPVKFPGTRII